MNKEIFFKFCQIFSIIGFVSLLLLLAFSTQIQRKRLYHEICIIEYPKVFNEQHGRWKMGDFVMGYSIETDNYIIVTGCEALYGQCGGLAGPGLVDFELMQTFKEIYDVSKEAHHKKILMTYCGNHVLTRKTNKPFKYNNLEVIELYNAKYLGNTYEVKRCFCFMNIIDI